MPQPVFFLLILTALAAAPLTPVLAQHAPVTSGARPSSIRPDIPPKFPGGAGEMKKFLLTNLQYPATAADHQVSGKVVVAFTVQTDGSCTGFNVVSPLLGYGCEEEALRVAALMPRWEPARKRTTPVPVLATLTLPFGLLSE